MLQRTWAVMQKEFAQTVRDRGTLAIMLLLPLLQLILFGYAINMNVRHIPLAVADQSLDAASRELVDTMVQSGYFDLALNLPDQAAIKAAIDDGSVRAGLVIPPNFAAEQARNSAQVLFLVDGSDLFTSVSAYNAGAIITQAYSAQIVSQRVQRAGAAAAQPSGLEAVLRVLYNPDMKDVWFIIPGIIAMLIQTQTSVLTVVAVVRERETGTIEQLLVSPIRPVELMVGKLAANILVALFNLVTILVMAVYWFQVPFRGSLPLFMGLVLIYIFSGLGMGLLISTVSQNQRQAMQLIMMVTFLGLILSGFIFPRYTMPPAISFVGYLFPMTYFIPIARGIITKGTGIAVVAGEVAALAVYSLLIVFLAARTFRQRLE